MFDGDYLKRVYKTTFIVLAVAVFCSLGIRQYVVAGGLVAGTLVGIATLWSWERTVRRVVVPGAAGSKQALVKYAAIKYPILASILAPVVLTRSMAFMLAFIGGLALTHIVMFLKAIGAMINERING